MLKNLNQCYALPTYIQNIFTHLLHHMQSCVNSDFAVIALAVMTVGQDGKNKLRQNKKSLSDKYLSSLLDDDSTLIVTTYGETLHSVADTKGRVGLSPE